mmetsp:Transcript_27109/g.44765  ORF Transcript_27109/g.44765 Transcript_27109/m.44765 type:complete len:205 (-) Transcript_27109:1008-1622(-)
MLSSANSVSRVPLLTRLSKVSTTSSAIDESIPEITNSASKTMLASRRCSLFLYWLTTWWSSSSRRREQSPSEVSMEMEIVSLPPRALIEEARLSNTLCKVAEVLVVELSESTDTHKLKVASDVVPAVGAAVGASVGPEAVGPGVEPGVGAPVGVTVGPGVGAAVGESVAMKLPSASRQNQSLVSSVPLFSVPSPSVSVHDTSEP